MSSVFNLKQLLLAGYPAGSFIYSLQQTGPFHILNGTKTDSFYWLTAEKPTADWLPEEGWAEVDGDAGEPDHEQPEANALGTVLNSTKCQNCHLLEFMVNPTKW